MSSGTSRSQWIAVGIIVAVLGGALTVGAMLSRDLAHVTVGSQAPDFHAINLATGDTVSLADYRGEVVLLNLWATWCAPCRHEMPSMERLHAELADDGLKIVAVSVDQIGSDGVLAFAEELGLTFDILHDQSGETEVKYQTTGLPETVILDRDGKIVHKAIGPVEWDDPVQIERLRRLLGVAEEAETSTNEVATPES